MGDIEKRNNAGRGHDIDLNRLVYEVQIRYPDLKVGTFVNATLVLAIDAEIEELLFQSITGRSKNPFGFTHPGMLSDSNP
jgi:hypothetical protein